MQVVLFLILALILAVPVVVVLLFNMLVRSRNLVEEGWSGIDVQLRRRANLVPALVETVRGYAAHESRVFEAVTRARSAATAADDPAASRVAENGLTAALRQLFALAEAYPDLKADRSFTKLQDQLAEVEDEIQKARRYYNGAVRRLNTQVQQFPSNLVARQFGFEPATFFEIDDPHSRQMPEVSFAA